MITITTLSGNIGAGKSSLYDALIAKYNSESRRADLPFQIHRLTEPVDIWCKEGTLRDFCQAVGNRTGDARVPESVAFQMRVLQTQIQTYERLRDSIPQHVPDTLDYTSAFSKRHIILSERSPMDGLMVFVRAQHAQKLLNDIDATSLIWLYERLAWRPDSYIFVNASAETCARRIRERGRPEELSMSDLDGYVSLLHSHYQTYHDTVMTQKPLLSLNNECDGDITPLVDAAWAFLSRQ